MNQLNSKHVSWSAIGFVVLVSLIALGFFSSPGTDDVLIWKAWMEQISDSGLIDCYANGDADYPPLSFVIMAGVVKCAAVFGATPFVVLKFSLFVFLLATAACFYCFTRNLIFTAALELALILNSVALGYLDIYVAPFLMTGLFFLRRGNLNIGFVLFAISCMTKWQPLIIAPFVCLYVLGDAENSPLDRSSKLKTRVVPFVLAAGIVAVPLLLIFGWKIFDSLHRAMTFHIFLSAYGLNLSWIHTWILHLAQPEKYGALQNGVIDIFQTRDFSVIWPEKILFYCSYAILLIVFFRQPKTFQRLIIYSILGYMAYFIFNTGVHENHLFLACCLGWILAFIDSGQLIRCINLSIAANANLFLLYGAFGQHLNPVIAGVDITLLFAVANICLFAGMLVHAFKADGLSWRFWRAPAS
jgi:hypothetical protein